MWLQNYIENRGLVRPKIRFCTGCILFFFSWKRGEKY